MNRREWKAVVSQLSPFQLPTAMVMSYSHNAETAFSKSITDVDDEAAILLDKLNIERVAEVKSRPILFISHSLGEIIVKK
jgi:hypothetical protein